MDKEQINRILDEKKALLKGIRQFLEDNAKIIEELKQQKLEQEKQEKIEKARIEQESLLESHIEKNAAKSVKESKNNVEKEETTSNNVENKKHVEKKSKDSVEETSSVSNAKSKEEDNGSQLKPKDKKPLHHENQNIAIYKGDILRKVNLDELNSPPKKSNNWTTTKISNDNNGNYRDNRGPRYQKDNNNQQRPFNRKDNSGGFASKPDNSFMFIDQPSIDNRNQKDQKKKTQPIDEKKTTNKRTLLRKGLIADDYDVPYIDDDSYDYKVRKNKKKVEKKSQAVEITYAEVNQEIMPIKTLSEKIGRSATSIVGKLMILDVMKNINDSIDFETAQLVASEFGTTLELKLQETAEDKFQEALNFEYDEKDLVKRPPVVTIMGHVDHGKTSLLDYIRKAHVAQGEAGGITQHIGAYGIKLNGEKITFLDTPGHEAFTTMRRRGAMVTDIAVIVVAADDGVMPQTVEAISHAKEAGVSIIVAANKIDKPQANLENLKTQLSQHNIVPEEWGGDVMVIPVSAKTGQGVDKLLESILLIAELKELKAPVNTNATGTIIEARIDKGAGPIATVLIKNGTLKIGDYIVAGTSTGKVKNMMDDKGATLKKAYPSDAVSILGFSEVPEAGEQLIVFDDEKLAKKVASDRIAKQRDEMEKIKTARTLEDIFKNVSSDEQKTLSVIIKGDVQGSVEAVRQAVEKQSEESLQSDNVNIKVVHAAVGAINESDVSLADTSNSIIIAFNVRPDKNARDLAEQVGVDIRQYRVIYDMINELQAAIKGMLDPTFKEELLGHAEVRETFKITGVGTIAGCYVVDGKIIRNKNIRLVRDNIVIYEGELSSLKRMKDDVKEVAQGYECGIGIKNYNDIKVGDVIEVFTLEEEKNE